ncbi:MAG TPA: hypothetical protein VME17_22955 [Bryobacteraceae bacterium]|nr:hypothetical protein [Bryobacteraceae bacterium]
MWSFLRIWSFFLAICCASLLGAQPGMRYLDEIDGTGTGTYFRPSILLGQARASVTAYDQVRVEGRDAAGKVWRALLPISGGLGYTTVWEADFDLNSRPDLLIASEFPKVGRCLDAVTLAFLLFDERGKPIPWLIQTLTPFQRGDATLPAVFSAAGDGKLKLVATNCEYSAPPVLGEDRSITGIYEAKDAMWRLVRPERLDSYIALVQRKYRIRDVVRLLPVTPAAWPDRGNFFDETQAQTTIHAVLSASPECRGIRLPIGTDGRVYIDPKDPCKELGKEGIQLSDGSTCYGWPTVMVDRSDGREIVAETARKELEPLLKEIAAKRWPVTFAGQKELGKCSPSLLWTRARN